MRYKLASKQKKRNNTCFKCGWHRGQLSFYLVQFILDGVKISCNIYIYILIQYITIQNGGFELRIFLLKTVRCVN